MEGTVTCDNHPHGGAHFKVQLALEEDMKRDEN
jgi:two-component system nitrogen regulation sensor histidine kinase GlnL